MVGETDVMARKIVAYGLRNPFRFAFRPGTGEMWVGDVGWGTWEEINRVPSPVDSTVDNMGWPCYEGAPRSGYDAVNLAICEDLYADGPSEHLGPVFAYNHANTVVPGETCPTGSSSISGIAFYGGGTYPATYANALFFADYSRDCIWVMRANAAGVPDSTQISTFVAQAANPVDLQIGPGGDSVHTPTSTAGRSIASSFTSGNQPRSPWPRQRPAAARRHSTCCSMAPAHPTRKRAACVRLGHRQRWRLRRRQHGDRAVAVHRRRRTRSVCA